MIAGTAWAQSGRIHVTEFGRRVLGRTDLVVDARVKSVRPPFRGVSTARLEVDERLRGFDTNREIVLLFMEDYVAPDAFTATLERSTVRYERKRKEALEPDEPEGTSSREVKRAKEEIPGASGARGVGVRLAKGEEGLFFLRRQGHAYRLVGFVATRDPLYRVKRRRLIDVLRIEDVAAFDVRVEDAKRFYLKGLASRNVWERANSARELMALAARFGKAFTEEETRRMARFLFKEQEPPILAALERAVRAIDPEMAMAFAEAEEERARVQYADALERERKLIDANAVPELRAADVVRLAQRYGRAATAVVASYLDDGSALVRERAAQALAELGGPSGRAPLRAALRTERDTNAATAMIYACGVKGDPSAVDVLESRLDEEALRRPALHALARIGTPGARAALEGYRKRADKATAELIDSLLREEFAENS